jgi:HD domain/GAF domain
MDANTQRLVHTFSALADLGQEIADAASFDEMLDTSFRVLLGSLAIRRGAVAEYNATEHAFHFVVQRGLDDISDLTIGKTEEAKLIAAGVSGLRKQDLSPDFLAHLIELIDTNLIDLIVPLIVQRELIGLVLLGEKSSGEPFTSEDVETVCALSRHVGVGIHSHRLLEEVERKAAENQRLYEGLRAIYKETVRAFAAAIDMKDKYTQGHSVRVGKYAEVIAREMGWSDDKVEGITIAGYLHDIGKLIVDLSVINSPDRFSAKESKEMSRHPAAGYEILSPINHPYAEIPLMARYHHERIDGKGYPDGLKGDEIPAGAKIVTLADSFDAMTTDRPYRAHLPLEHVLADFRENTGTQFDPEVVCAFCRAFLKEIDGEAKDRRIMRLLNRGYQNIESVSPMLASLISDLDSNGGARAAGAH